MLLTAGERVEEHLHFSLLYTLAMFENKEHPTKIITDHVLLDEEGATARGCRERQ
jgi:hypothetical protein